MVLTNMLSAIEARYQRRPRVDFIILMKPVFYNMNAALQNRKVRRILCLLTSRLKEKRGIYSLYFGQGMLK
jgi:hypothetical protein